MSDRPYCYLLLIALVLTLGVRAALVVLSPTPFSDDPDAYGAIAVTLSESGVFGLSFGGGPARPTAFRPPLYPWIVSFFVTDSRVSAWGVGVLHIVLAGLTTFFVFDSVARIAAGLKHGSQRFSPAVLAFIASMIVVLDPVLLRQFTHVMTETLATTLAAAGIWAWVHWCQSLNRDSGSPSGILWSLGVGAVLALAYLCRPTFLVWAVLLVAASALVVQGSRRWKTSIAMGLLVVVAVLGWTLRNKRAVGDPIWATSHGGYTLLLANNESFYDYLESGSWGEAWDANGFLDAYTHRYEADPREEAFWRRDWQSANETPAPDNQLQSASPENATDQNVTEKSDDRLCYESAVATIQRRPATFVWSCVVRAGRLWSPFPHDVGSRSKIILMAVGFAYLSLFAVCLFAIGRHRRKLFQPVWWSGWLLAFALTGIHAVYWSNMRMRAPVIPAIAMIAVFALVPRSGTSISNDADSSNASVKGNGG